MSTAPLLDDTPSDALCRICQFHASAYEDDPLLSPCLCTGSVRWVHRQCLDRWRSSFMRLRHVVRCELCGSDYVFEMEIPSQARAIQERIVAWVPYAFPFCLLGGYVTLATHRCILGVATTLIWAGMWSMIDAIFSAANVQWRGSLMELGILGRTGRRLRAIAGSREPSQELTHADLQDAEELQADVQTAARAAIAADEREQQGVASCCREEVCAPSSCVFIATPWLIVGIYWCLAHILKRSGLTKLAFAMMALGLSPSERMVVAKTCPLDANGSVYPAAVVFVSLTEVVLSPPLSVRRNAFGLPFVRSLTTSERESRMSQRR